MFEAIEARANAALMNKLANATAVIGGRELRVIFDSPFKVAPVGYAGMAASTPQITMFTADVPANFIGSVIAVDDVEWAVADREPDGAKVAGWTTVPLEKP